MRDKIFSDEEFQSFQLYLCLNPEAGDVLPETGVFRKIRWHSGGRGKRGGARVIYFLRTAENQNPGLGLYQE